MGGKSAAPANEKQSKEMARISSELWSQYSKPLLGQLVPQYQQILSGAQPGDIPMFKGMMGAQASGTGRSYGRAAQSIKDVVGDAGSQGAALAAATRSQGETGDGLTNKLVAQILGLGQNQAYNLATGSPAAATTGLGYASDANSVLAASQAAINKQMYEDLGSIIGGQDWGALKSGKGKGGTSIPDSTGNMLVNMPKAGG